MDTKIFRFITLLLLAFLTPISLHATEADLIQAYQWTLDFNSGWAAEKELYASEIEIEKVGLAALRPLITASGQYAQVRSNTNKASSSSVFDFLYVDYETIGSCLFDDSNDSAAAFTSCVSRASNETTNNFSTRVYALNFTQPLFNANKWYTYKSSKTTARKAVASLAAKQQNLQLQLIDTYFHVIAMAENVEYSNYDLVLTKQQLETIKRRYQRGLLSSTDVYKAQSNLDLTQAGLISAENNYANALESLESMTQVPHIEPLQIPAQLPIDPPHPDSLEYWINSGLKHNYYLKVAQLSALTTKQIYLSKKADHAPTLDLVSSYTRSQSSGDTNSVNEGRSIYKNIGLQLNIPIYSGGGTSAKRRQQYYKMKQSKFIVEHKKDEIISNTKKYYRNVLAAIKQIDAQKTALISSKKSYIAAKKSFQRGSRSLLEVLSAQREFLMSQKKLSKARFDYIHASVKLKHNSGLLSSKDLTTLNAWLVQPNPEPNPTTNKTTAKLDLLISSNTKKNTTQVTDLPPSLFPQVEFDTTNNGDLIAD